MLYLRICFDKPDAGGLRDEIRKHHREYVGSYIGGRDGIKVVQGGPMCATDDISKNVGSFLVVEADSLEDALRFHNDDPATRADLFDRSDVVRWDRHVGDENRAEYVP